MKGNFKMKRLKGLEILRRIILLYEAVFLLDYSCRNIILPKMNLSMEAFNIPLAISVLLMLILTHIDFGEKKNRSLIVMLLTCNFMIMEFLK